MKNIANELINLIYPNICGICNIISKEEICPKCKNKINSLKRDKKHIYLTKQFDTHFYVFDYQDLIKEKILQYKFQDQNYLAKTFVKILLNDKKICGFFQNYDIIVSVPISKKRKRRRGYNQSELIAKKMAKELKIIYQGDMLYKVKDTIPQMVLDKEKRIKNVVDAYEMKNQFVCKDKKILLFDDIYTTGSTVNECSRILKKVGANEIGVFTLAKD